REARPPRPPAGAAARPAAPARLPCPVVYLVLVLVRAEAREAVAVVGDRRAAVRDRAHQDRAGGVGEARAFGARQPPGPAPRPHAGLVQDLADVDVAEPSDLALIAQQRLHRRATV